MKDVECNIWWIATKIILGFLGTGVISIQPCFAQSTITPDNTLGTEASQVTPNVDNPDGIKSELIEGGAQRGQNLFHSFQEFNVNEGRGAYFLVPNDTIQNVLTRVTGTNRSEILGILGTISNRNFAPTLATLFLINPNGIVFGRNASLDVNGSFVGTTANAVEFGGGFFSATNPQAPSGLLTVNPSAFLFNQINAQASIQNNSVAPSGLNPSSEFTARGLRVLDGKSLLLVGGDINMDGGGLYAFGGRVELGGSSSAGTVGLNGNGNNLSLSFPASVERSNVSLSNGAGVRVTAGDGGSIAVNARNLEMTGESELAAGIDSGLGSNSSKAGNIVINATGAINLKTSVITNQVASEASGQGGDVSISASSTLRLEGMAQVSTSTSGAGDGGDLTVNTDSLQLKDNGIITALSEGTGAAGDITLNIQNDFTADNGQVLTEAQQSSGGNITITARKNIFLHNNSDIKTTLSTTAGSGGNIRLEANSIVALEDSDILTFVPEEAGGSIIINTLTFLSDPLFPFRSQTALGASSDALPHALDGNNRVDVDATGCIRTCTFKGTVDNSFIENSLLELAQNPIDTAALVANSCVVRSNKRNGTFFITGKGGLPYRPGDAVASVYAAVDVQSVAYNTSATKQDRRWKIGDPIVEPTGVYRLDNGQHILSRECGK